MHNKKNNKGFSLVELIVVVAIMAVLVGVLAPAYLRYVEDSREQKDISAVGEVVQAIKIAAANEDVAKDLNKATAAVTVTLTNGSAPACTAAPALATELADTIGTVNFSSADLTGTGAASVSISVDATGGDLDISVTNTTNLDFSNIN